MRVGDLVRMDFTNWPDGDAWGAGIVVNIGSNPYPHDEDSDVEVLWSKIGLSWEMVSMLEKINEV